MRDLVMNWLGVSPKSRLVSRVRRCEVNSERRASHVG